MMLDDWFSAHDGLKKWQRENPTKSKPDRKALDLKQKWEYTKWLQLSDESREALEVGTEAELRASEEFKTLFTTPKGGDGGAPPIVVEKKGPFEKSKFFGGQ